MLKKLLVIIGIGILFGLPSYAQKTQEYADPLAKYKEALTFFDREYYTTAQQLLREYLEKQPVLNEPYNNTTESHARYLIAVCALELFQPDAEKLLIDFIYSNAYDNVDRRTAYFHLGRYYFRERDYDKAIEWLKKVEVNDLNKTERDEYKFLLAYCYFFSKDLNAAYPLFKQIKDNTNKYYYPANYYYGYISFTRDEYDEALESFKRIEDSQIYERILPFYISQIYFRRGEYQEVIKYLEPKIEDKHLSYYSELNMTLGQSYFELGKYEEALPYLEVYHQANNKVRKEDIYQFAYTYYKTGDYGNAVRQFEYLDDETDSLGQNALYLLADSYLKTGNKTNARSAYQKAAKIGIDKQMTEYASFNYAKLSYEAGYDNEAVTALQEFIDKYPNSKNANEAKELLSELFLSAKDYNKALAMIESIQNKSPQVKTAYQIIAFNRGVQLFNDRQYEEALEHFELSLKYPVGDQYKALAYYWKGECHYLMNDYQKANWQYAQYLSLSKTVKFDNKEWYDINGRYGAGYSYLKRRDYGNAATYFEQTVDLAGKSYNSDIKNRILPDAILRSGDAYYLSKDYTRAVDRYNKALSLNVAGQDYALYQKAYIQGLQGNYNAKGAEMLELQRKYPSSKYADIALFEGANTYFELGNNSTATSNFNKLIQTYPKSQYYNQAYLKLGLIYFNESKFKQSTDAYEMVLKNAPSAEEVQIAVNGIKDIAVATGDKNLVASMMKRYPGTFTSDEAEKIVYDIAENHFRKEEYATAIERFNEYLIGYSNGAFALNAHFYRGESRFITEKYVDALEDYMYVINQAPNRFLEPAVSKAARIQLYEVKDNEAAYKLFKQLLTLAEGDYNKYIGNLGLMRATYRLKRFNETPPYANFIMNNASAQPHEKVEANFYLGKAAFEGGNYTEAKKHFQQTVQETSNEWSVEAAWSLAFIRFKNGDYDGAIEKCYEIINEMPSYPKWIIKSYILLGESYYKQGNVFQAKATLESIIENYEPEDELKAEAREKLDKILKEEAGNNKIAPADDTTGTLEELPGETIDLVNPEDN